MLHEASIVQDWINEGKGIGKKLAAIDDSAVLRFLLKKSVKVESLEEFARLLDEV